MGLHTPTHHAAIARPRFAKTAGHGTQEHIQTYRTNLSQAQHSMGDIVLKRSQDPAAPTTIGQGVKKLKQGLLTMLQVAGLAGLAILGGSRIPMARQNIQPATVIQQNQELAPDWSALVSIADTAEQTRNFNDVTLQGKFNTQVQAFLTQIADIMAANPQELDQTLIAELTQNADFMPWKNAYTLSTDFIRKFMPVELAKANATPETAALYQINSIDVLNGFINHTEALQALPEAQKQDLADKLLHTYIQHRFALNEVQFSDHFVAAFGSGIDGISLENFYTIDNEADAKALYTKVLENGRNFKRLQPGEREALLNRGLEIIDSLEYPSQTAAWGLTVLALAFTATTAIAATGVTLKKWRSLIETPTAIGDFHRGLTHPTLVIHYAELGNPEAERNLSIMVSTLLFQASEIERLIKEGYETHPQMQELLTQHYGGKESLPIAQTFIRQAIFDTKSQIMAKRSLAEKLTEQPIDELGFVQQVLQNLQDKYESGTLLEVALPKGMLSPEERPDNTKSLTEIEQIRLRRKQIQYDIRKAQIMLANLTFSDAKARNDFQRIENKLALLEQQGIRDGKIRTVNGRTEISDPNLSSLILEHTQALAQAEKHRESTHLLLTHAKLSLGESLQDLQNFELSLTDAIQNLNFVKEQTELETYRKESHRTLQDPQLQTLIEQAELQKYIQIAESERQKEKADIEAQLQALGISTSSATARTYS